MEIKIWGVVEGPISVQDFPEQEEDEIPVGSNYVLVCKAEIDGVIEDDNFWFEDLNDAYEWKKYFSKNIEPLVVDTSGYNEYN
tara:strand:- start:214 stop:462 length:249 start_codon:yes stop_codon:yes gene_type:complete